MIWHGLQTPAVEVANKLPGKSRKDSKTVGLATSGFFHITVCAVFLYLFHGAVVMTVPLTGDGC
jgi:hypothetical protein